MEPLSLTTFENFWSAPEIAANVLVALNMIGALILGLLVGFERSFRGRAAGMRTYGLVCMASCALTSILGHPALWYGNSHLVMNSADPTRVLQGIVSGIGFLGAGVIMRFGMTISGLTTAASIWSVSVIGILVGVGFYASAFMLSFLSFACMMWGAKLEHFLPFRHAVAVEVIFNKSSHLSEDQLRELLFREGYDIAKGSFGVNESDAHREWHFVAVSRGKDQGGALVKLSNALTGTQGMVSYRLHHARN